MSGNTHPKVATLENISIEIHQLRTQKETLEHTWEQFRNENGTITQYIKSGLNQEERNTLSEILQEYLTNIRISGPTLEKRRAFFSSIEVFISEEKKESFEVYKNTGFDFETERTQLKKQIEEKQLEKDNRTDILRTHIADNALERRSRIQSRVEPLLRERLDVFISNPGFQTLSAERKQLVFGRILSKIQAQQSLLERSELQTTVVLDRIETYKVIESIMQEYIKSWN
ncbi:hypothetical protein LAT59_03700 [Candidatus Gracilibacteria bacterium]|nr:hypothetical protein [Candidatus Gracilibacteria bacterium]